MKKLTILGSTGSIGKSTLQVVQAHPHDYQVQAMSCYSNLSLFAKQVESFKPTIVCVVDREQAKAFRQSFPKLEVLEGEEGLVQLATLTEVDIVVNALVGFCGIAPTLSALKLGKRVGLANKEVLVAAGKLIMDLKESCQAQLLPIDSEHSAIFQCLNGEQEKQVSRLILTASGGPFREYSFEQLKKASYEEALKHPNWSMGQKITVDSSTLMNKGLEVIEAYFLFGVDISQIEVTVHPQSLIHSMVEFVDHAIIAQISQPCMTLPIQYALSYPDRIAAASLPPFDFTKNHHLSFSPPDTKRFPCLALAFQTLKEGKSYPCYLNAANEVLVSRFLNKEIPWFAIGEKLSHLLDQHTPLIPKQLSDILHVDSLARNHAQTI